MAACLRSAVGFYNGGGVNPQPTPVPTTDLATFREIEWNGATVKVLCDTYGRLFTSYDSANNVYNGVAWTDEGLDKTFDSIEGHEEAFMALLSTYGHNDAVTGEGVDNVVISLDGSSTEFTFTEGQCVPVPSLWQQGAVKTLFYRTLNDGTKDINVLCDTDGKLIVGDGAEPSYLEYTVGSDQIGFRTANRDALIAAAGGSVVADVFSDNDGNYILVSLDGYTVVADLDGIVVQGDITQWLPLFRHVLDYGDHWNVASFYDDKYVVDGGDLLRFDAATGKWFWAFEASAALPSGHTRDVAVTGRTNQYNGQFTVYGITYVMDDGVITPAIVPEE